jgi:hypothetical protein
VVDEVLDVKRLSPGAAAEEDEILGGGGHLGVQ